MNRITNILIVDDSNELLDALKLFLEMNNFTVSIALSKEELDGKLKIFIPDLILLDVVLRSNLDGKQICRMLKENDSLSNIPIILMSGYPDALINYQECMADDILVKPFELAELLNKINLLTIHPISSTE